MSEVRIHVSTSLADVISGNAATVAGTPSDSSVSPTALPSTESASYIEMASSGDPDKLGCANNYYTTPSNCLHLHSVHMPP